jgi:hypothetical protein
MSDYRDILYAKYRSAGYEFKNPVGLTHKFNLYDRYLRASE